MCLQCGVRGKSGYIHQAQCQNLIFSWIPMRQFTTYVEKELQPNAATLTFTLPFQVPSGGAGLRVFDAFFDKKSGTLVNQEAWLFSCWFSWQCCWGWCLWLSPPKSAFAMCFGSFEQLMQRSNRLRKEFKFIDRQRRYGLKVIRSSLIF